MKAAVWNGPFDLSLKEVPIPSPSTGEVLIRTKAVGVCGSDLEIYDGRFKQSVPPLTLGHEGGGIVEAVGEGVRTVAPGDRVAVECVLSCGRCEYCRRGEFGLCESGGVLGMIGAQGEYAEYFVAPEKNCYQLPSEISWPEAGLIDTLAGPVYAMQKLCVPLNGTVAVFGPGPAGLFFCRLSKLLGAARVYLVGTRDYRLQFGEGYGADRTINVHEEDAVKVIRSDTGGKGVNIVVEASGSEKALNEGIAVLKKGGVFLLYGVFGGGPVSIDIQPIQLFEYNLFGTSTVDYPPAINLIETGAVNVGDLISHRFDLEGLIEAFSSGSIENRHGDYMKGVVLF